MSTVTYGTVVLDQIKTNRYSCTPVMSADGLEYLYTCHRYDFNCTYNPALTSFTGTGPDEDPGHLPAETFAALRHYLMQPRRQLTITHGPDVLIYSPQPSGPDSDGLGPGVYPCDAAGGPFPRGCYLVRLGGDRTWTVNWVVETYMIECPDDDGSDPLLSNRYEQTSVVDDSFMTTLITRGQAEFRLDILEFLGRSADQWRSRVLPLCPTGFIRKQIAVSLASEKRRIHYEVRDVETWFDLGDTDPNKIGPDGNPGSGAVNVEGSYRVATVKTQGGGLDATSSHSVDIRVTGQKASSLWRLTQLAISIAMNKLPIGDITKGFITHSAVVQDLTRKAVALQIAMQLIPAGVGKPGIPTINDAGLKVDSVWADLGGLNPQPPNDGGTRGSADDELAAAAIRAACGAVQKPSGLGSSSQGGGEAPDDGSPPPEVQVYTGRDVLPDVPNSYSEAQQEFLFDDYHIDILYETDEGVLACPVASGGVPTSSSPGDPPGGVAGYGPGQTPPDAEALTVARPKTTKVVQGTCSRVGAAPILPRWAPTDPNLALLRKRITPAAPECLADGQTFVYRVSFWYQYLMRRSYTAEDSLAMGSLPLFNGLFADNMLTPDSFADGIIDGVSDGEPAGGGSAGDAPPGTAL